MEKKMDYYGKMAEALDLIGDEPNLKADHVLKAKRVFAEVSDFVQNVPLFSESKERRDEYRATFISEFPDVGERIVKCWIDFLNKAVGAPTKLHTIGCIVLQIPILHQFIQDYENSSLKIDTLLKSH